MTRAYLAPALAALLLASCGPSASKPEELNLTDVTLPSGAKFQAETMIRDADLARGMMYRDALPKGRGMIFMFPKFEPHPLFMFHCKVPLDLVWMDKDQRIVRIIANVPPCTADAANKCPVYGVGIRARYALELNAGQAAAYNLKPGDHLDF